MQVFGLTGGLASGKSSVAKRLLELGVPVIDADKLAREAVAAGTPALKEIADRFGSDALDANGALDRAWLAEKVFHDADALRKLNAIVHPQVAALFGARVEALSLAGQALCCYEVPLLFENGLAAKLRPVVVVAIPEALQVERAIARGLTREQAEARIRSQWPLARKLAKADFVINNEGTLEETRRQTEKVLEAVKQWPLSKED